MESEELKRIIESQFEETGEVFSELEARVEEIEEEVTDTSSQLLKLYEDLEDLLAEKKE